MNNTLERENKLLWVERALLCQQLGVPTETSLCPILASELQKAQEYNVLRQHLENLATVFHENKAALQVCVQGTKERQKLVRWLPYRLLH